MVFSIEHRPYLSLKIDGRLGKMGNQDTFVVTSGGAKTIAALDRNIIRVAYFN